MIPPLTSESEAASLAFHLLVAFLPLGVFGLVVLAGVSVGVVIWRIGRNRKVE